jgi:hypothetical protein
MQTFLSKLEGPHAAVRGVSMVATPCYFWLGQRQDHQHLGPTLAVRCRPGRNPAAAKLDDVSRDEQADTPRPAKASFVGSRGPGLLQLVVALKDRCS